MLRVTPYPAFADRVAARRGAKNFASPLPASNEKKLWHGLHEHLGKGESNYLVGQVKGEPVVQAAMKLAKAERFDAYDRKTVAVGERLVQRGYSHDPLMSFVPLVAKERGLAEMIAMKLESVAISHRGKTLVFEVEDLVHHETPVFDGSWKLVRAILADADDASYAAARDVASAWRTSHPIVHRIAADYFFPDETTWANEDIDAMLPHLTSTPIHYAHCAQPVFAVTDDLARLNAFMDKLADYHLWSFAGAYACELTVALSPADAMHALCNILEKSKRAGKLQLAEIGVAMCALEGDEMAAELAGLLLHSPIGPFAVDYFRRFPALAKTALAKTAQGTSKAADAARSILAASAPKEELPLADASEIPAPLRDAPWRKKKKTKAIAFDAPPPMPASVIDWADGEREAARRPPVDAGFITRDLRDMTAEVLAEWLALPKKQNRWIDFWPRWKGHAHESFRVPDDALLRAWNEWTDAYVYFPLRVLAIHGEAALPGLFARDAFKHWSDDIFETQLRVIGPESARVAAEAVVRRKGWRRKAQDWIAAHASIVAQSLAPAAVGKEGKEKNLAMNALRIAARADHDAVIAAARALGADVEHAVREIIDGDPLAMLDVKGKVPPFVRPEDLPALATRSKKRLPIESSIALLEILRSSSADAPYAGLASIREALDEKSLGDFAWAIVSAWTLAGSKASFDWIPMTLAHIGDDASTRRFAPYVREWARKDAKKAMLAADVLSAIGTSTALLHLSYVADKSRFEPARAHAKEALERTAAEQGLTIDELADRTVPDLDLDATGKATLDFGARTFSVTLDEGLRPVISSADGAKLPAFPRGTKTDDGALVKAASARFKGLKADAESVAMSLLRRFERAMIHGRAWRADAFRAYVVDHPLVGHVGKRLVWRAGEKTFRVAEDRSFADAKDVEYTLPEDAIVALPHALDLGRDATIAWSRILSDYGVVQPFEQLARATFATSEDALDRFAGRKSKAGPLMGSLDARGWTKSADQTSLDGASKTLRLKSGGETTVWLSFSPGIELDAIATAEEQTFAKPTLRVSASEVHPIDFSELVRDLEALAH